MAVDPFWTTVAGVAGALVGGGGSQWLSQRFETRRRAEDRAQMEIDRKHEAAQRELERQTRERDRWRDRSSEAAAAIVKTLYRSAPDRTFDRDWRKPEDAEEHMHKVLEEWRAGESQLIALGTGHPSGEVRQLCSELGPAIATVHIAAFTVVAMKLGGQTVAEDEVEKVRAEHASALKLLDELVAAVHA
jgi:hypothetical protein